ncbi:MAG: hypothetical protein FWH59_04385 [Lentimicrobiaceae bacterium]|nr:hypothetical protein [Lentimicrobiaceae bacterium]
MRFLASLGMTTQHVAKYAAAVNAVLSFCPCAAATSVNGQRVIPNAVRNLELSVTNFYINYPDFAKQNQVEWKFIYINYPDFAKQNHPFKI